MRRALLCAALVGVVAAAPAHASPNRMALVVGNNTADAPGLELGDLAHAERDAIRLREQLVGMGRFDPDAVEVVVGGSRADVLEAAKRIAVHHRRFRANMGADVPTLFAFFFTGHGLREQLLTEDGALTGSDLATIFTDVGATTTLGVFDACHSGAFDLEALRVKGIEATPGFNPGIALPTELPSTQGVMWLTSSLPDEVSYEDPEVGSLFTHYFIEAFGSADRQGPAVDLDAMWHYARRHTMAHAARFGRTQTPSRRIRQLESSGPLYLSFPARRSATIVLAPEVEGTWLLRSVDDGLVERVEARAGKALAVPVHPGRLQLGRPGEAPSWTVELRPGERLTLGRRATRGPPGYRFRRVRPMGGRATEVLSRWSPAATWHGSVGAAVAAVPDTRPGAPIRLMVAGHRVTDRLTLDVRAGYGWNTYDMPGLTADLHAPFAGVGAGLGGRLGSTRLEARLGVEAEVVHLAYPSASRTGVTPAVDIGPRLWLPLGDWSVVISGALRGAWSAGLARLDTARAWDLSAAAAVDIAW